MRERDREEGGRKKKTKREKEKKQKRDTKNQPNKQQTANNKQQTTNTDNHSHTQVSIPNDGYSSSDSLAAVVHKGAHL